MNNVSVT